MKLLPIILGLGVSTLLVAADKEIKEIALSAAIYNKKMTQEHMNVLVDKYADATGEAADSPINRAAITFELSVGLKDWSKQLGQYSKGLKNHKPASNASFNELVTLYAKETKQTIDTSCQQAEVGLNAASLLESWASKLKKYSEELTVKAFKRHLESE